MREAFDTQIAHRTHQQPRYEGEATLVGWLTSRSAGRCSGTSGSAMPPPPQPCHQLDYGTSGLLVLGKSGEGLSAGSRAFDLSGGGGGGGGGGGVRVQKEYTAVVLGWPRWDRCDWEGEIDADPTSPFKMRVASELQVSRVPSAANDEEEDEEPPQEATACGVVDASVASRWGPSRLPPAASWSAEGREPRPRKAHTRIDVVQRGFCALHGPLRGRRVSLVKLMPTTGRRHQLRLTLAHLGHPILGDVAYAGDLSTYRLMIHASALTFSSAAAAAGDDAAAASIETRLRWSGTGPPGTGSLARGSLARGGLLARTAREGAHGERRRPGGLAVQRRSSGRVLGSLLGKRVVSRGDPFEGVLLATALRLRSGPDGTGRRSVTRSASDRQAPAPAHR